MRPSNSKKSKIFACILYILPVLFFVVSYFLITTSGEDIWQGANNFRAGAALDPWQDALNAFRFNSRITDMYAWAVIDFFDYQFAFGPDIVFRLVDVAAISTVFYLATYLILGRRPRLVLKDALVFCACFAVVAITPFGRTFYIEFSMIHNYVPLALVTLIFSIPYIKLLCQIGRGKNRDEKVNSQKVFAAGASASKVMRIKTFLFILAMLVLGVIFGMSATITPLAFLITLTLVVFIKRKSLQKPPLWFFAGIVGAITGFAICWLLGSGVDHYTNPATATTFDYVSLGDIFTGAGFSKLIFHEIYNFGITLIPLFACIIAGLIFAPNRRQFFTKKFWREMPKDLKIELLAYMIFLIIHVLGASLVKAPPRLLIPAYFAGVIVVFRFFVPFIGAEQSRTSKTSPSSRASVILSRLCAVCVVIFTTFMVVAHTFFLIKYRATTAEILEEIKTSEAQELCIDEARLRPPRLPLVDLSQANILVNWGTPEVIYGKNVTFCD